MHRDLNTALRDAGLAVDRPDRSGLDSVYLHPKLAGAYMAGLADRVAETERCDPTSDNSIDHIATSGLTVERLGQVLLDLTPLPLGADEVETELVLVALRMVVPKTLRDVPVDKLIKFRKKHREELTAYQDFIAWLTSQEGPLADLAAIRDRTMLKAQVKAYYEKRFEPDLDRLRRAFRRLGLDTVDSAMSIRLPARVPLEASVSSLGVATAPFQPLFAGAAFGLAAIKVALDTRKRVRRAVRASPTAFLMFAGEELSPQSLFGRVRIGMRHVALGA